MRQVLISWNRTGHRLTILWDMDKRDTLLSLAMSGMAEVELYIGNLIAHWLREGYDVDITAVTLKNPNDSRMSWVVDWAPTEVPNARVFTLT
jgi:hypothetical protein